MYKLYVKPLRHLNYDYSERANHPEDAGMDLYVQHRTLYPSNEVTFIKHEIQCEMSHAYTKTDFRPVASPYCLEKIEEVIHKNVSYLLVPRSSIAKTPLLMANSIGIIDAGYRGEIIGAVYNTSKEDYVVEAGTRLFQIVLPSLEPFDVEIVSDLSETVRGEGGFGSTGK